MVKDKLDKWSEYRSLLKTIKDERIGLSTKQYFLEEFTGKRKYKAALWRAFKPQLINHYTSELETIRSGDRTFYTITCDVVKWCLLEEFGQNGRKRLGWLDDRLYEQAVEEGKPKYFEAELQELVKEGSPLGPEDGKDLLVGLAEGAGYNGDFEQRVQDAVVPARA